MAVITVNSKEAVSLISMLVMYVLTFAIKAYLLILAIQWRYPTVERLPLYEVTMALILSDLLLIVAIAGGRSGAMAAMSSMKKRSTNITNRI